MASVCSLKMSKRLSLSGQRNDTPAIVWDMGSYSSKIGWRGNSTPEVRLLNRIYLRVPSCDGAATKPISGANSILFRDGSCVFSQGAELGLLKDLVAGRNVIHYEGTSDARDLERFFVAGLCLLCDFSADDVGECSTLSSSKRCQTGNSSAPHRSKPMPWSGESMVLTIPACLPTLTRNLIREILVGKLEFHRVYFVDQNAAVIAAVRSPAATMTIISIGHSSSSVTVVHEGCIDSTASLAMPLGMTHVNQLVHDLALRENYHTSLGTVFTTTDYTSTVATLSGTHSYTGDPADIPSHEEFSDILRGASEVLFSPEKLLSNSTSETLGIPRMVQRAYQKCNADVRARFFENILLVSGGSKLRGFASRYNRELELLFPEQVQRVDLTTTPPDLMSFEGASIVDLNASQRIGEIYVNRVLPV